MTPPHTLPAPLGTLVYRAGLAAEADVQDALAFAERHGRRLGEVLMQRGLVNERDLTNLLATQRGLASVSLAEQTVDAVAAALLSEDECRTHLAIPFRFQDGRVVLAIADPTNDSTFDELATVGGREVVFVVASRSDIYAAIDAHFARRAGFTNGSQTVPQAPAPAALAVPTLAPAAAVAPAEEPPARPAPLAVPTLAPAAAVAPAEEPPARPASDLVVPVAAQDAARPPAIDAAPATPAAPGVGDDAPRVAREPQIAATRSNDAPAAPAKDVPAAPAPEPRAQHQQEIVGRPEPETPVILDSEAQSAVEASAPRPESREPAAAEMLAEPEPEPEPEPELDPAPAPGPAPRVAEAAPASVAPLVADAPAVDRAERSAELDRDVRFRHVDLRVSEPRAPEEARPALAPPAAPDGGAEPRRFRVVLHLEGGESLDVETFDDEGDAFAAADQLADELADRRGWPRIGRLLIPAARIVALEVQEVPTRGSGGRRRAGASGSARDDAL